MSVRRLAAEQPASFAFSNETLKKAQWWIAKYPPAKRQSAVIPILWLVQKQEGWVCEPAIRAIATILRRHAERLNVTDFERAAEQFVSLAIDHNLRLATLGIETPQREIETRVEAAVDLFLAGTLRR